MEIADKLHKEIVKFLTDNRNIKATVNFSDDNTVSFCITTCSGSNVPELFAVYNKKKECFAYCFEDKWYYEQDMLRIMKLKSFI